MTKQSTRLPAAPVTQHFFPEQAFPAMIARAGAKAQSSFVEFFTATIRNVNTRAAYWQATMQFAEMFGPGIELCPLGRDCLRALGGDRLRIVCEVFLYIVPELWRQAHGRKRVVHPLREETAQLSLRFGRAVGFRKWDATHLRHAGVWMRNAEPGIVSVTADPQAPDWPLACIEHLLVFFGRMTTNWQAVLGGGGVSRRCSGLHGVTVAQLVAQRQIQMVVSPVNIG